MSTVNKIYLLTKTVSTKITCRRNELLMKCTCRQNVCPQNVFVDEFSCRPSGVEKQVLDHMSVDEMNATLKNGILIYAKIHNIVIINSTMLKLFKSQQFIFMLFSITSII